MTTLKIKNISENYDDIVKEFVFDGLEEEKKKLKYAYNKTLSIIKSFEKKFGISTSSFINKFKNGEIEENNDTFDWWAETKVKEELEKKLNIISNISNVEIC